MSESAPFKMLFRAVKTFRCWAWLGLFGGPSAKGIQLWSNHKAFVGTFRRKAPKGFRGKLATSRETVDPRSGRRSVHGIPKNLKASQVYPAAFGVAVAGSFARCDRQATMPLRLEGVLADAWKYAKLNEAFVALCPDSDYSRVLANLIAAQQAVG